MSDYNTPFNSLENYIPSQLRNVVNTSLMSNLFDRLLTHDESVKFYGVIGEKGTPNIEGKPYITESTTDRYYNSLTPAIFYKIGAEEHVFTFKDLLNKAMVMGIDVNEFAEWGKVRSYNLVPPINIDAFVNFSQYYWIEKVIPSVPYAWNPNQDPEYYTIARPKLTNSVKFPVDLATTTNIALNGTLMPDDLWAISFSNANDFTVTGSFSGTVFSGSLVGLGDIYPGTTDRYWHFNVSPYLTFDIIKRSVPFENGDTFTLNVHPLSSTPTSIAYVGTGDGYVANTRSTLSYGTIDGVKLEPGMRVLVKNQTNVAENGIYTVSAGAWSRSADDASQLSVFVKRGSQIGTWSMLNGIASLSSTDSNVSIWTETNFWIHRDDLAGFGLTESDCVQALRPIIEYDIDLELSSQISHAAKLKFNQVPLFNLYDYNSQPVMVDGAQLCSALFYYKEDPSAPIDQHLQRRVVTDNFSFVFEHGVSYQGKSVFFKKGGQPCTLWVENTTQYHVPEYVMVGPNGEPVPYQHPGTGETNPNTDLDHIGDWLSPFQLDKNPEFSDARDLIYGDLHSHLASIIEAQPGLTGSSFNRNNFRELDADLSLGGTINLVNNQFNLFAGLMNQESLSPITVIDFAEQQYKSALSSLIDFIDLNIGDMLTKYASSSTFISDIFAEYKTYYAGQLELQGVYDASIGPIPNWPLTLPMMRLLPTVQPEIIYNPILSATVMVHHDGHQTAVYPRDIAAEQLLTGKEVVRFDGQTTTGTYGVSPPTNAYKGQFWFDSVNKVLKVFKIDYEGTIAPITASANQYWFDRTTSTLSKFDGISWIVSTDDRWFPFAISDVYNALTLKAEMTLFNYCNIANAGQPLVWNLNNPVYLQEKYLAAELSKFAIANKLDPYGSNYVPADAFTWNYGECAVLQTYGIPAGTARWHKIYEAYLGTARPDIEPWKIIGLPDLATLQAAAGATPIWDYVLANTTKKICVDPTTGTLLPPYVSSTKPESQYALITNYADIVNPTNYYSFGQGSLTETVWRYTVDYNYALLRASMKADPINTLTYAWGFQTFNVGGLRYDKITKNILTHHGFTLHSEARANVTSDVWLNAGLISASTPTDHVFDLTVTSASDGLIVLSNLDENLMVRVGEFTNCVPTNAHPFYLEVQERSVPLLIGDKVRISQIFDMVNATVECTAEFIPNPAYTYQGLNQVYVTLKKYNGLKLVGDRNDYGLRRWNTNLIYRTNYMLDTSSIAISTEQDGIKVDPSAYDVFLKVNEFAKSSWLHALRIQVVQVGSHSTLAPGTYVPNGEGTDWIFRIENYFPRHTALEKYVTDHAGVYETFQAIDGAHTNIYWKHFIETLDKEVVHLPVNITGIQNVVTFLNDYVMYATNDGWAVNQADLSMIDPDTGRAVTWQLETEKFIDTVYRGISAGMGIVFNPFMKSIWFNTPQGLVANFNHERFDDISTGQLVYDIVGDVITPTALTVIRQDNQTRVDCAVPMFGGHVNVNEFEHVIVFKNYNYSSLKQGLLYDQFLGIKIKKLLIRGKRQSALINRPTYGGFYLNGDLTSKNIAAAIDDVANYYYSDATYDNPTTTPHALALFGFSPKTYFSNLNIDKRSEFNFWRGMIPSKGSNYCLNAFINSVKYETARIDEFWAYKVAEYGDAREKSYPELKVQSGDCALKHTRLFFAGVENDTPTDVMTTITNDDESRWYTHSDLSQDLYFSAKTLNTHYVSTTEPNQLIELPFIADELLIFDSQNIVAVDAYVRDVYALASIGTNPDGTFIRQDEIVADIEAIEAIVGSDVDIKTKVQIVNNRFIYVLVPGDYSIVGYAPMRPKYSPIQLYDYRSNVFVENIPVWHPIYSIHTPEAVEAIDIISSEDPTKYNRSLLTNDNPNYDPSRCWGDDRVGTIWWDTTNLDYIPYSDKYIYPSFEERLIRWGSLAEYASINVYEWVKSDVPPSQYDALAKVEQGNMSIDVNVRKTGYAAKKELYRSDRTWQGRAVAWSYVPNPSATEYIELFTYAVDVMYLSSQEIGDATVVLENGTFEQYGLTSGMSIGGWVVNKPYGELVLGGGTGYFVGSSGSVGASSMTYAGLDIFSHFVVELNTTLTTTINVGQVIFSKVQVGTNYFLRATNQLTNVYEDVLVLATNESYPSVPYIFSELGFTVTANVLLSSSDYSAIADEFINQIDLHIRNYQNCSIVIPFNSNIMDNTLPVVSPNVYFDELNITGLINIATINVALNRDIIGNYTLTSDSSTLTLSNNGYEVETINLPDVTANFSLVFDILTINITMTNLTSKANFVDELLALLSSMTVGYNGALVQFVTQDPNVTTTTYNWRAWKTPSQADLTADTATPFSSWTPVYGDWIDLPPTRKIIESITSYNKSVLTLNSGKTVEKYNSVWSGWTKLVDELQHVTSVGTLISFTMSKPIDLSFFSLYINGINQPTTSYTFDPKYPTVITLNSLVEVGDNVTAYLRRYQPTSKELAFDPDVSDVPATLTKYKYDYEYVTQPVRDASGTQTSNAYYFWVQDRAIVSTGKSISSQEVAILLKSGPSTYMTFQDMRIVPDNGYESVRFFDLSRYEVDSLTSLNMVYKAVTIANLGMFVTKDDTYKLRFTRDFTLRTDPNELDLKNVHTEWTLIRPNSTHLIPVELWNLVVDSACGYDIAGNPLPNANLIDYDKRHGTNTRYGSNAGQIFIDTELVLDSLRQAILNPKTVKWVNGEYVPDTINTIDRSNPDSWFVTPESTRALLTQIWTTATPVQINGIFFEVLEDALANNYQFSNLFKTSRISAHSITTNQPR